jgi:hypothetical protein
VGDHGLVGLARSELAGHAQVNEQVEIAAGRVQRLEREGDEFSKSLHTGDAAAGELLTESDGIINEVGFAEAHAHDSTAYERAAQTADDCLDFG